MRGAVGGSLEHVLHDLLAVVRQQAPNDSPADALVVGAEPVVGVGAALAVARAPRDDNAPVLGRDDDLVTDEEDVLGAAGHDVGAQRVLDVFGVLRLDDEAFLALAVDVRRQRLLPRRGCDD
jgi:hypothetical protein